MSSQDPLSGSKRRKTGWSKLNVQGTVGEAVQIHHSKKENGPQVIWLQGKFEKHLKLKSVEDMTPTNSLNTCQAAQEKVMPPVWKEPRHDPWKYYKDL